VLPAVSRLDDIPGISLPTAQVIIAEIGLDMTRFPTAGHVVSWAKLTSRTIQSGLRSQARQTGKGNPYQGRPAELPAADSRPQIACWTLPSAQQRRRPT
jgi:Transposase IS116/IS110/IS902 family